MCESNARLEREIEKLKAEISELRKESRCRNRCYCCGDGKRCRSTPIPIPYPYHVTPTITYHFSDKYYTSTQ